MSEPFVVECRKDAGTIAEEFPVKTFSRAVTKATAMRRNLEYHSVFIRRVLGLKHRKPYYWGWNRNAQTWEEKKWYDQAAAGKKPPPVKGEAGLFG